MALAAFLPAVTGMVFAAAGVPPEPRAAVGLLTLPQGAKSVLAMSSTPFSPSPQPVIDPLGPLITLDSVSLSGSGPSTLRVLAIEADGTLVVHSGGAAMRSFRSRLRPAELADLQAFILEQHRFADIDGAELARQVGVVMDDAATVVITVQGGGGTHRVALEALPDAAAMKPEIEPLRRLNAVYQRLMRLVYVGIIGGETALLAAVAEVNAVLLREHPQARPLTDKDLLEAHALPDGGLRLSLLRVDPPASGQPGLRWYAEMQRPSSGVPQVKVWRRPI